jgi:outer membrane protein OmpA-like peptidoglycan-associated protein
MKLVLRCLLVALAATAFTAIAFCQEDVAGSKDYPGITRMPGYYIYDYSELPFDSFTFTVKENGKTKDVKVEGHKYDFRFNLKDGAMMPSPLQILRNYQNAARAAGGQVLYEGEDSTTIRLGKGGQEAWVVVNTSNIPSGMFITMTVIEKEGMKQEVTMDAAAMAQGLSDAGEVAIYGIYFDTGKADLKPESEPAVEEIAKLLKAHPLLKVFIVGHTDMVGDPATNVKLSQTRAQAVVTALVTAKGIAGSRLTPFGAGPYAPVASNKTEDGRAKNRRVELVEIATK